MKAIELFGPERCMFENNFPVDKVCFLQNAVEFFKKISIEMNLSKADKDKVLARQQNLYIVSDDLQLLLKIIFNQLV